MVACGGGAWLGECMLTGVGFLWEDENVLKLESDDVVPSCECAKN